MLRKAYPFFSYIYYWLKKEDAYSLQSPFLFRLTNRLQVFITSRENEDLDIEQYRDSLLNSTEIISVNDLGAGSKRIKQPLRKISDVTKFSTSTRKYAQLYQFFCSNTPAKTILELGTCVGITSRYLANIAEGRIFTFEGSEELARVAQPDTYYENLELIIGDLTVTLPSFLDKIEQVDFAFIDATHTYEATLSYFRQIVTKVKPESILIIGDIHWSKDMNHAWETIKSHPSVRLSLDYYECGVLFFDFPGQKSEYILDF